MSNSKTIRPWVWFILIAAGIAFWSANPLRSWRYQRQAHEAFLNGDPAAAKESLEAARLATPRSPQVHLLLARAARRLGDLDGFLRLLQQARELGLPRDQVEREQWILQAQAGDMETAEQHLPQLLRRDATDLNEVCAAFVSGYVHNYEFGQAFRYLDAWELDFPQDPEPHIMRARIRQSWHNVREAEKELRIALQLRPTWRGLPELLAQVLTEQNRFEEAAELLADVARKNPGDNRLQLAWADCLIRTGKIPEAKDILEKLEPAEAQNSDLLFGLGRIDLWEGNAERGLERLSQARQLDPQRNDIRYAYAQALAQAGQIDEARIVRESVERVTQAQARIFELSEQLVKTPQDLEARLEIGRTLLEHGDVNDGVAWLETILRFDPRYRPAHETLAEHYRKLGDEDRARQHAELAQQRLSDETR